MPTSALHVLLNASFWLVHRDFESFYCWLLHISRNRNEQMTSLHTHMIMMMIIMLYPVCCAEVYSLCKVVALIEAAVIGSWEGNNKLSCTLIGPIHLRDRTRLLDIFRLLDINIFWCRLSPSLISTPLIWSSGYSWINIIYTTVCLNTAFWLKKTDIVNIKNSFNLWNGRISYHLF